MKKEKETIKIKHNEGKPIRLGIKEGKRLLKKFPKGSTAYNQIKERLKELKSIISTKE